VAKIGVLNYDGLSDWNLDAAGWSCVAASSCDAISASASHSQTGTHIHGERVRRRIAGTAGALILIFFSFRIEVFHGSLNCFLCALVCLCWVQQVRWRQSLWHVTSISLDMSFRGFVSNIILYNQTK